MGDVILSGSITKDTDRSHSLVDLCSRIQRRAVVATLIFVGYGLDL